MLSQPMNLAATAGYPAPVSVYSPYTQQMAPQQPSLVAAPPLSMAASALTGALPPGTTFAPSHMPPRTTQPLTASTYPGTGGYQPIMYWYPSPPVSPQSAYYVQACPTTIIIKGLPFNIQVPEILAFFDGIFEVSTTATTLSKNLAHDNITPLPGYGRCGCWLWYSLVCGTHFRCSPMFRSSEVLTDASLERPTSRLDLEQKLNVPSRSATES